MIAYSSYNKKDSDVSKNAFTIGISNSVISILAGFVVFGTLGFMADYQGVAFDEVVASNEPIEFPGGYDLSGNGSDNVTPLPPSQLRAI